MFILDDWKIKLHSPHCAFGYVSSGDQIEWNYFHIVDKKKAYLDDIWMMEMLTNQPLRQIRILSHI